MKTLLAEIFTALLLVTCVCACTGKGQQNTQQATPAAPDYQQAPAQTTNHAPSASTQPGTQPPPA